MWFIEFFCEDLVQKMTKHINLLLKGVGEPPKLRIPEL